MSQAPKYKYFQCLGALSCALPQVLAPAEGLAIIHGLRFYRASVKAERGAGAPIFIHG